MKLKDAIAAALAEAGAPLHYREITAYVLQQGLWQSSGKTPEDTVSAQLSTEIKQRGAASPFQRTGPGEFALRGWGLPEFHSEPSARTADSDPQASSAPKLSFLDAAEQVLMGQADHKPLHYREVTRLILEQDLVQTKGLTPEATLYAQILTETKRRIGRGEAPRFVLHGKGYVGLAQWMGEGLAFQIAQHNTQVRHAVHKSLMSMPPERFEALIAQLLVALGFEDVIVNGYSGDGGIDVRGILVVGEVVRTRMAVQVKRWKHNVQAPVVQMVRGSLGTHEQGLIITTSDYSKGARDEAQRSTAVPVALMHGEQLVNLLVENDLCVVRRSFDLIDPLDEQASGPSGQGGGD